MGPCEDCWWWHGDDEAGGGETGTCDKVNEPRSADEWCEEFEDRREYLEKLRVELGIEEE